MGIWWDEYDNNTDEARAICAAAGRLRRGMHALLVAKSHPDDTAAVSRNCVLLTTCRTERGCQINPLLVVIAVTADAKCV